MSCMSPSTVPMTIVPIVALSPAGHVRLDEVEAGLHGLGAQTAPRG